MDQLENQLDQFIDTVESSADAKAALYGPITTAHEKSEIVKALGQKIGAQPLLVQFLTLLGDKSRMSQIKEIRNALVAARVESTGGLIGTLVSAEPMHGPDVDGLAAAFGKKLGKKISFQVSTDSALLAGMKVTVNGVTYDGSLRSQLQRLRDRFVSGFAGK
jgi:F-type H+-transporting ATPase subunit delta